MSNLDIETFINKQTKNKLSTDNQLPRVMSTSSIPSIEPIGIPDTIKEDVTTTDGGGEKK